jgi:hypothetical protein
MFTALAASGCHKVTDPAPAAGDWSLFGGHRGRYVGLGIYSPSEQWTKIADSAQAANSPAARPIDDQAIYVVIDSATGELRACGDLTGYCIGTNPWKKPLSPAQIAPIVLTEHVKPPEPVEVTSASLRIHVRKAKTPHTSPSPALSQ